MTYPLIESNPITLDEKCKFCQEHKTADSNLNSELESLAKIKKKMNPNDSSHMEICYRSWRAKRFERFRIRLDLGRGLNYLRKILCILSLKGVK